MICNDVEAFLSHTPAWMLRSPFALPRIVGIIMHNGDINLTFGDTGIRLTTSTVYYSNPDFRLCLLA